MLPQSLELVSTGGGFVVPPSLPQEERKLRINKIKEIFFNLLLFFKIIIFTPFQKLDPTNSSSNEFF